MHISISPSNHYLVKQRRTLSSRLNYDITCPQNSIQHAMYWPCLHTPFITCQYIRTHILTSNQLLPCHSNSNNDNLILKTNCGIEMPTKHSTQQAITDHRIVLNSVQKNSHLTVPKSEHKPLNNLSYSSPRKQTIT